MNNTNEEKKAAAPEPMLACVVLESGTVVGPAKFGRGHRLTLPKSQAEALASLKPARVRIEGV